MHAADVRQEYLEFFAARGHSTIARSNLVPREDPTTLFTGSGMQPLIPFLLEGVGGHADLMQRDGLHPNAQGARMVAATVFRWLQPMLSK